MKKIINKIKSFYSEEGERAQRYILSITVALGSVLIAMLLIDKINCNISVTDGIVVQKVYTPKEDNTSSGMGFSPSGPVFVTTGSYNPEDFAVIVLTPDGRYSRISVPLSLWYQIKDTCEVKVFTEIGCITGDQWRSSIQLKK